MKKIAAMMMLACVSGCATTEQCQKKAALDIPPQSHPDSGEWTDLFAPDLSNAIKPRPAGIWTFEDGVLTASKDRAIWTKKDYDNFVLDLEFKNAEETNSGVIIYCSNISKKV